MQRLLSIDLMRGMVMMLMALDHTRHVFAATSFSPTDLNQTTTAYFLTRWITHLCAPTFVFLAGTGAFLAARRRNLTPGQLAAYLASRGLWLIVLELTLIHFGWNFHWHYHVVLVQVMWALGWSLISLALLIFLPIWAMAGIALAVIVGHNAFDGFQVDGDGTRSWLWMILHKPGKIEYLPGYVLIVSYPLIPWFAVMATGYCLGPLFLKTPRRRKRALLMLGLAASSLFILLRLTNLYGDPKPWEVQNNFIFTVLSVLNCTKYPPSLLYLLMTLGLMFLFLLLFEWDTVQKWGKALIVFGNVPLFFYLLHLPAIHLAMLALSLIRGLPVEALLADSEHSLLPEMPDLAYSYDLPAVYMIWLALLVLLYPICSAFARFKQRYRDKVWLHYL